MAVLHLIVGPNGAGKSTLHERVMASIPLEFVNADVIAADVWPGDEEAHGYEAAAMAAQVRSNKLAAGESFVAETVFSHPSKLELVQDAVNAGYLIVLHVVVVPEDLSVARVADRVRRGGHSVPEDKIRGRYQRLWSQVGDAIGMATTTHVYDNSSAAAPLRLVATFRNGVLASSDNPPTWLPTELSTLLN